MYNIMDRNQIASNNCLLSKLFFKETDIAKYNYVVQLMGKISVNELVSRGVIYEEATMLKYMFDICSGKVSIENDEDLAKHLRKINGQHKRISLYDLAASKVNLVPRKAIVAGIPKGAFDVLNSNNYSGDERLYEVKDISSDYVNLETSHKPVLKYRSSKKLDGILEIKELKDNGNIIVAVNKKNCRLCNRFAVFASLRRPEFYLLMYEIICYEGTKVYVFAQNMGTNAKVKYSYGTQRVYDYGFAVGEIQDKVRRITEGLYKKLGGVRCISSGGNCAFTSIDRDEPSNDEEQEAEIKE